MSDLLSKFAGQTETVPSPPSPRCRGDEHLREQAQRTYRAPPACDRQWQAGEREEGAREGRAPTIRAGPEGRQSAVHPALGYSLYYPTCEEGAAPASPGHRGGQAVPNSRPSPPGPGHRGGQAAPNSSRTSLPGPGHGGDQAAPCSRPSLPSPDHGGGGGRLQPTAGRPSLAQVTGEVKLHPTAAGRPSLAQITGRIRLHPAAGRPSLAQTTGGGEVRLQPTAGRPSLAQVTGGVRLHPTAVGRPKMVMRSYPRTMGPEDGSQDV